MKFLLSLILVLNPSVSLAQAVPGKISDATIAVGTNGPTNYIKNPSAIFNVQGITLSSATGTRDIDTADKLDGKASWLCDSSSQNGYCEFDTNTIQEGDKTGNCEAKALIKGDASLYKLQVTDGSSVLTSSSVLPNVTGWTSVSVNYPCGATREVRLTQTESGTGAAVNIGRVYWGQSTNLGAMNPIGDWQTYTPTGTWVANTTYTGRYRRVGDSIDLEFTLSLSGAPTAATLYVDLPTGISIDTNKISAAGTKGVALLVSASTGSTGQVRVDTGSSLTRVQILTNLAQQVTATSPATWASGDVIRGFVTSLPIAGWGSQTVVNDNITPWYIDATMDGANPSLGIAAVSSYTEIIDAGLTLKPQSGSAAVGVMCSTTNAATSPSTSNTTCAAGSESVGINFSIPKAGSYEVCAYFTHALAVDSGETISSTFQLIETPTNAQTLTLEGGSRMVSGSTAMTIGGGTSETMQFPNSNCSIFNWSSNGIKGVRLMYEQTISGTPNTSILLMDAGASAGQRNGRFTVKPVTASSPMPLLTGSVTSNSSGLERIERAVISPISGASCTVGSESGDWLGTPSPTAAGDCTIPINSGMFSAAPVCTCATSDTGDYGCQIQSISTSSIRVNARTAGVLANVPLNLICMGSR